MLKFLFYLHEWEILNVGTGHNSSFFPFFPRKNTIIKT